MAKRDSDQSTQTRLRETLCATVGQEDHDRHFPTRPTTPGVANDEAVVPVIAHPNRFAEEPFSDRYHIEHLIGQGGGGSVFRAHDAHLDRHVAIKVLHDRHRQRDQHRRRFVQEARIAARLDHPGILPVYDLDIAADKRPWFTMREIQGQSLDRLLEQVDGDTWPEPIARIDDRFAIMLRVCEAIAYAHAQGVIHQDLKPGNIVLGTYGQVLVIDWGTAVTCDQIAEGSARLQGTPMYMSPEQATRCRIDPRCDVYCLGTTFRHLLSGRFPLDCEDPDTFWQRKRLGSVDPLPSALEERLPSALLRIIDHALAPDPRQRPADASALLAELRTFDHQREASLLLERARACLGTARTQPDHPPFTLAIDHAQNALARCPDLHQAAEVLQEAREAYARFALSSGDLGLARSICTTTPPITRLTAELTSAERQQHAARRRAAWSRVFALTAVLLVACLAWWSWRDYQAGLSDWEPLLAVDFADTSALPAYIQLMNDRLGTTERDARGLNLQLGGLWIKDLGPVNELRIEWSVTWPNQVDGFDIISHTPLSENMLRQTNIDGYSLQIGGYLGSQNSLSQSTAGVTGALFSTAVKMQAGQRYQLVYEISDHCQKFQIDESPPTERFISHPINSPAQSGLLLRSWSNSSMILHDLRVFRRLEAQRIDPLLIGDRLHEAGRPALARAAYLRIASNPRQAALAGSALARAITTTSHDPRISNVEVAALLDRLRDHHPTHPGLSQAIGILAQRYWLAGHTTSALDLIATLSSVPGASAVVDALLAAARCRPDVAPADLQALLTALVALDPQRKVLSLERLPITDLSPVRTLALQSLNISDTAISDLSTLRGLNLTRLDAAHTAISDLSPLAGMPLNRLDITSTLVSDLSPLRDAPLQSLLIRDTAVQDLSPLATCPLRLLFADDCPLETLPNFNPGMLRHLSLHANGQVFPNFSQFHNQPLRVLQLSDAPGFRLEQLTGTTIRHLVLKKCQLSSLDGLDGLPLHSLDVSENQIMDLSQTLWPSQLTTLSLNRNPLTGLTGLPSLRELHVFDCPLESLAFAPGVTITDLLRLGTLNRPLPLEGLVSVPTLPARIIWSYHPDLGTDLQALRHQRRLLGLPIPAVVDQQIDIIRALCEGDRTTLLAQATQYADGLLLSCDLRVNYPLAQQLARRVGAQLPQVQSRTAVQQILAALDLYTSVWLACEPPAEARLESWFVSQVSRNRAAPWFLMRAAIDQRALVAQMTDDMTGGVELMLWWPLVPADTR